MATTLYTTSSGTLEASALEVLSADFNPAMNSVAWTSAVSKTSLPTTNSSNSALEVAGCFSAYSNIVDANSLASLKIVPSITF